MSKNNISVAFKEAEKELEEKKVQKFKEIVKSVLEKIETLKRDKQKTEKEILIHKRDIDDLKNGRMDLILERQNNDKDAKEKSLVKVEKLEDKDYSLKAPLTNEWIFRSIFSTGTSSTFSGFDSVTYTCGTYLLNNGNSIFLYRGR